MTTHKRRRGAKRAPFAPDYLANVPTPLHAGQRLDWAPAGAQRTIAERAGAPADAPALAAGIEASTKAWSSYREALAAADVAAFPGQRPTRLRLDLCAGVYARARLGAWIAALGDDGRGRWAQVVADGALARALRKRTGGGVTLDLIPDLPGRCDLTDAAHDVAARLERGLDPWRALRRDLDSAADACAEEALADMGWTDRD